ncbi:conjugal transfer protein [Streptococcus hyovaginalis]
MVQLVITVICSVVFSLFFFLLLFLVIFFADDTDSGENNKDSSISQGGVTVSPEVLAHRPLIEKYGKEYGIEDYVSYILAIMQVESGGTAEDVMQSSESLGLPPNSLSTEESIKQGVKYFSELLTSAEQQTISSSFHVVVHIDESDNMVIIKNPTMSKKPQKSDYQPKQLESDHTVDTETMDEITSFLETFFQLYPTATEKELTYYVSNHVLPMINKEYVFEELVNPIFTRKDNQVIVNVAVKYLDQETKATQISQFELILEKQDNWKIVK